MASHAHHPKARPNLQDIWQITSGRSSAGGHQSVNVAERAADGVAWILSLWFGCGLVPKAPGTAGTIGALPLYLVVRPYGALAVALTSLVVTVIGIWASTRVARASKMHDPQFVCIDEVAGVFVTWIAAGNSWFYAAIGFVLFRLFDMYKPFPARQCERLPGGFGIVFDDLAAGAWAAVVLLALRAFA